MRRRTTLAALATGAALVTGVLAVPPSADAAGATASPHAVPRATPTWTAHARHLGAASSTAAVHARVYLAPRGGLATLQRAATAAATPGSATYHKFLTPAQYAAAYQPSTATVGKVAAWLRSSGLKVTKVEARHRYLTVSGTVAGANKAFSTSIGRYVHNGRTVQAPSTQVKVPAALASSVLTVSGLDTTPHIVKPSSTPDAPPPGGFRNAHPCSLYYGQLTAKYQADFHTPLPKFHNQYLPYATCGYTGPQFRAAYEGNSSLDGSGQTVAITDAYASPTIRDDIERYATNHGDGGYARGQYTQARATAPFNRQGDCGPSGWYGEETLDVEAVHAMAPGAKIRFYPSPSCYDDDFLDTLANVVDEDLAQVVSNSWSDVEQNESPDSIAAYENVFLQGALEGISFMFSSGDSGDEVAHTGLKQVDYPASDPYATAVGGTSDAIGADGNFQFQTGWGTVKYALSSGGGYWSRLGFLYGAGGGQSALFDKPDYQQGVAPDAYRAVPDVGLDGDPNTGMLIGITQTFPEGAHYSEYRIGGTSLASPLFAGMTALSLQNGATSGAGLLNPVIYDNARSGAFTDVRGAPDDPGVVRADFANGLNGDDGIVYSVRTFNQDSSLSTNFGWDNVTGVGAPNPQWLQVFSS
jgi:subtilase family serine protease